MQRGIGAALFLKAPSAGVWASASGVDVLFKTEAGRSVETEKDPVLIRSDLLVPRQMLLG